MHVFVSEIMVYIGYAIIGGMILASFAYLIGYGIFKLINSLMNI